ncbi:MAG TPA: TIGR04211 family SH3 domain-containing protein [Steroidobacteraceae bacterium]|nr:TIGR04211 family SH3 domain-containing protein [Steroidobacteraceae bacterium]
MSAPRSGPVDAPPLPFRESTVPRRSPRLVALAGLLVAGGAAAATAYVSDDLVLGVYAEPNGSGQRLTTLHSGAAIETLDASGSSGEFTQVRLADGRIGWVKSTYLTTRVPATVRMRQLEEELDRRRATTPELAAAAARSELEALKGELAAKDTELAAAREALASSAARPGTPVAHTMHTMRPLGWVAAMGAALLAGFGAGYATLARRIRQKYGGLKIY